MCISIYINNKQVHIAPGHWRGQFENRESGPEIGPETFPYGSNLADIQICEHRKARLTRSRWFQGHF